MKIDKSNIEEYWVDTCDVIKTFVTEDIYNTHFKPIEIEIVEDTIILTCINDLSKSIISNNYLKSIKEIMQKRSGISFNFVLKSASPLIVNESKKESETEPTVIKKQPRKNFVDELSMPLNNSFCFETFVIGNHNRLANACAESVSKTPGKTYNPLFIYGASGLGKTHLMQAIGNRMKEINPYTKVFYTTGENFTSLYVDAVRENKLGSLRKKIRNYDMFLLDDIQFLLNKEGTITEFFHTFNALYDTGKQIVLTSDRAPKDLDMDERLLSRFEQGMFTVIEKPDFETRLAILKEKCISENMAFSNEVLEYVAKLITANIRQLQGALTKLLAEASLLNKTITLEFAEETLDKYYRIGEKKPVNINTIQEKTAAYYNVTVTDLIGQSRTKDIVLARQVSMYLARELTEMSLPAIGHAYGDRDHTTVIHSCRKIEDKLKNENGFRERINELSAKMIN